eukprot:CAMPEP_0118879076 /NCGR_PEP_ID=MMETSP1163-20130328/18924_1 /TAXON_ID=124430 /ORGANISM="Phaeomonas parva, Strain CCMP2877" /LENGTH=237 /DNA_ID=CAMNT_0006815113 /DNA_START=247 /DNA_END=957 /DNA_ORIENTATION=-
MAFDGSLNNAGLIFLLLCLVLQMILLSMTLTRDEQGLEWASREEECVPPLGSTTIEFYTERVCIDAANGERTCEDYDADGDIQALAEDALEEAEDDYGDAGDLTATCLTFTLIEIIMLVLALVFGDKVLFCKRTSPIWKGVLIFLNVLMILFCIGAAGVASDSDALERDIPGCDDGESESKNGYGVGICAFLVFWIIGQTLLIVFPFGAFLQVPTTTSTTAGAPVAASADTGAVVIA